MGGSKGSQTSSTTSSLPPQVLQNYQNVVGQAQQVAATPYQQYSGQLVAPENSTEQQATTAATNAQGAYQPYFDQAQNYINTGTTPITPSAINASTIAQYESPYNQQVINATQAQLNQNDAVQQQQLTGNAISAGAFGGDRAAVAASTLAGQQDLANNQTIAGLENQNYTQALGEANTQQQAGMTAQQANNANALQASGLSGALGNNAQNNQLSGASALMAAGQIGQQTQQNQNTAGYQQFEQQLAYPFQNTQYLANIVEGLGNQGGTSTTTQPSTQSNSVLGFLGLKEGGSVKGYDSGGAIPDFESSYVPNVQGGIGGGESSIPKAPSAIANPQQPKATLNGVMNAGKGIATAAGYLGQLGPEAGYALNAAGEGNAAYDAFAASDAAAAGASSMPAWMSAIASFFANGGSVDGKHADGGSAPQGYDNGGSTPPPFSWGDPNTTGMGISGYSNNVPLSSTINQMSGLQNFTPSPVDFSKGYVPLSSQISPPQQSSIPVAPTSSISNAASPATAGNPAETPQSLTDLQSELSKTAPVLDKDTAIWQGVAGALAGKNRGVIQNIGEGMQQGIGAYQQQKQNVADYSLKEASAQKAAEQMQIEADRYNKQAQIEQENADTNKDYKNIVGNAATQKVPVNDQIYAGLKQKQAQSNGAYTDDDLNKDYADIQQRMNVPRNAVVATAKQIQTANPGMSAEEATTRASQAIATGSQNAHVTAAEQIATNSATGKMLPEVQDRWNKQALAGETAKNNIQNIMTDIQGFDPAWGAATKLEAKRALQGIASNLGVDTPDLDKSVASQQMMNKTVNSMIMSTMGAQSSKWTNAEMGNIGKANPTDTMSPQAIKGIAVQAKAPFDYYEGIAKVLNDPKYVSQYRTNNNGSTMGIENDVQSRVSPIAYSYMRMSPDDKQKFYKSLDSGSQTKLRDEVNFMGNNKITPTD